MKWFKKWCRGGGKFVNHSKLVSADINGSDSAAKRGKSIRDSATADRRPKDTRMATASASLASSSSTGQRRSTGQSQTTPPPPAILGSKPALAARLSRAADARRKAKRALDKQLGIHSPAVDDIEQFNYASSSNSNTGGDGDGRNGLLPPKPRLFVISDDRDCEGANENDIYVEDCDYEPSGFGTNEYSLTGSERSLDQQARDLEQFISDPEETTQLQHRKRTTRKRKIGRGFFNIPGEVRAYRYESQEDICSDWVVVTVELNRTESCDSTLDENLINLIEESTKHDPPPVPERTAEETLVSSAPAQPSIDEDYGLIHTRNRHLRRLFRLLRFLDFDIRFGKPLTEEQARGTAESSDAAARPKLTAKRGEGRKDQGKKKHVPLPYSFLPPQEPCCSRAMDLKTERLGAPLMLGSIPTKKQPEDESKEFCVAKYFGLNDDGDIVIHYNHIVEQKGYGFLMRRKRRTYRRVGYGCEVQEFDKMPITLSSLLRQLVNAIKRCRKGHPRNKTTTGGPGDLIGAYALTLASEHTSTFSRNIENFISCTKESRESSPQIVMRNMRQFMSGMKNYLVKHGEGDFQREVNRARSLLKPDEFLNLDSILEGVMHKLVVLPLRDHLYGLFVDYYTGTGDIQLLVENVRHACGKSPVEFGLRPTVEPPSPEAMQQISNLIQRLQEAELPLAKLELLLAIVGTIIEATTMNTRGHALGADDFLPLLVYIVGKCGFIGAEIEAEFMWCLLQPSLLNGEAGYYLTALCSATHVLKSFITSEQEGTHSMDCGESSLPSCSSVLRVIIPDEYNGSLQTRTLPIRPHTTTKEVCRIIAHKARVTNPQDYGLFKLVDGEETLLMESECPQEARLAARGKPCMLAYKRIEAKIAWPTTSSAFQ